MADIPTTIEEVKALQKEMEELNSTVDKWNETKYQQQKTLVEVAKQESEAIKRLNELQREADEKAQKHQQSMQNFRAAGAGQDADEQERLMEYYQRRREQYEAAEEELKKFADTATDAGKAFEKAQENISASQAKMQAESEKRIAQAKKEADTVKNVMVDGAKSTVGAMKTIIEEAGPALTTLAVLKPELGLKNILAKQEEEFKSFDNNFRNVVKSTGLYGDALKKVFVQSYGSSDLLQDIGLTSAETAASMNALIGSVATFRQELGKADNTNAKTMLNMVSGLKKMGVAEVDSGKAIDQFVKVLGKTPKVAMKTTTSLLSLAESLNMSAGKAVKDFTALMPDLAAYGDRATEVFARMSAQAQATGVEISSLNGFAKKLDTFKGAAEFAQRFNAQLGGMHLSAIDLAKADLPDKITMIQEAMARSGKSFDDFGRQGRLALTSALGLESVETAARILNAKEEFDEANKSLNTNTMSQAELKKKLRATMTQMELLTASTSRQAAGYAKFTERTRKLAERGSQAMRRGFEEAKDEAKDGETAAIGMLMAFKGMQGTAGILATALKPVTTALRTTAGQAGIATGVTGFVGYEAMQHASDDEKEAMRTAFERGEKAAAKEIAIRILMAELGLSKEDAKRRFGKQRGEGPLPGGSIESIALTEAQAKKQIGIAQEIRKATATTASAADQVAIELYTDKLIRKLISEGAFDTNVINIVSEIDGAEVGKATFENVRKKLDKKLKRP